MNTEKTVKMINASKTIEDTMENGFFDQRLMMERRTALKKQIPKVDLLEKVTLPDPKIPNEDAVRYEYCSNPITAAKKYTPSQSSIHTRRRWRRNCNMSNT